MTRDWIFDQINILKSYEGSNIEKVMIWEMAIIESNEGKHLFEHPDCPFIQAQVIYLMMDDKRTIKIHTYQNNCDWGILSSVMEANLELNKSFGMDSLYRISVCHEFPVGLINSISTFQNENGDISEVRLVINTNEILLKSGEVYENHDGSITIKSNDESVLVFLNPEDLRKVNFDKI